METKLNKAFYTIKELNELGYSYYKIQKLLDDNILQRISHTYYENLDFERTILDYNYIPVLIKDGIICSLSASFYYGYTTYRPIYVDVAVCSSKKISTLPNYPPIRLHYMNDKRLNTGIISITDDVNSFKMFNKERTVCDLLLNRTKVESEEIKNVLIGYLNDDESDLNKLSRMAKELNCLSLLQTYLEVLL